MQIRNIVVPLDGSRLAEQSLPFACALARRSAACLRVVIVLPAAGFVTPADMPGLSASALAAAQLELGEYLQDVLALIREQGVRVTGEVRVDAPVDGILRAAEAEAAELIVIAAHERGVLRRAWTGSVTDELMRQAHVPLLVVRASEGPRVDLTDEPEADAVLVPLDGSWLAEAALEPALALARLFGLPLTLLRVVPGPISLSPLVPLPPEAAADLRDECAGAEAYLDEVAGRLRGRGAPVRSVVLHDDSVSAAIVACGLGAYTVMATHGLGGLRRVLLGSVTDEVLRVADSPVVVVRPLRDPHEERELLLEHVLPTGVGAGG